MLIKTQLNVCYKYYLFTEMVDPLFLKADLGWSLIKGVEAHKRVDLDTILVRSDLSCILHLFL